MRLQVVTLLRAYVPTQSLFSGNTLATVSAEPLNKFGLFDVIVSIDGDLYALVYQKVELAQQLSYQLPLVCQLSLDHLQPIMLVNLATYWFS